MSRGPAFYSFVSLLTVVIAVLAFVAFKTELGVVAIVGRIFAVLGVFKATSLLFGGIRRNAEETTRLRWADATQLSAVSMMMAGLNLDRARGEPYDTGRLLVFFGAAQLSLIIWVTYKSRVRSMLATREPSASGTQAGSAEAKGGSIS